MRHGEVDPDYQEGAVVKKIIAAAAAVLALAVPSTAVAHNTDYGRIGPAANGWVNYDEAVYVTVGVASYYNYHGGALRWNLRREAPWGDGTQDVELGVRFRDGSLGMSWVSAPCNGAGCHYTLSFRHPWT